ncbi:protein tincar [Rhipicephalus sanguineus]|uniref:protein tincar n=1 Tax=Rhipicephalus sanguineus TaxID=34632 RepID=UPI001893CD11|nr:protein tincar [Rhipicephalus sanguineus]
MCVEAAGRRHQRQLKNGPGQLNTLGSLWHCVAALALSAAAVAHSVRRFPELAALSPPVELLHAYVALVGVGVLLLPFVAAAALVRVGNLANDGLRLEGDHDDEEDVKRSSSLPRLCWRHGPPTAAALHAASALCLLLPRLIANAACIGYGLRPTGDVWRTELDVVMSPRERQTAFFPENLAESPSDADPPSVEFINYVLALVVCALRYPSVAWDSKRAFSLLFALYLALCALQRLLLIPAASVLYKAHVAGVVPPSLLTDPATVLLLLVAHGASVALSGPVLYCTATLDRRRGAGAGLLLVLLVLAALSGAPLAHDLVRAYASSRDCLMAAAAAAVTVQWVVWSAAAMLLLAPKKAPPPTYGCEKKRMAAAAQRPSDDDYATLLDVWRPEPDEAGPSVPWISHHHRHSQEERLLGRATVTRLTSFKSERDSSLYSDLSRVS